MLARFRCQRRVTPSADLFLILADVARAIMRKYDERARVMKEKAVRIPPMYDFATTTPLAVAIAHRSIEVVEVSKADMSFMCLIRYV